MPTWCNHEMVDLMCCFLVSGFCVLPFICCSPWICIWQVWVIGWDYSMFLCPSAPPWFRHQSLLHPVVGALSCWEYVSRRFEATCSWRAWPCLILSPFDILNWKATEISSCSLSLEFCVISQHLFLTHSGTLFSLGVSACSWRKSVLSLASSSLHWALELCGFPAGQTWAATTARHRRPGRA